MARGYAKSPYRKKITDKLFDPEENVVVKRYWIQVQDRMDRTDNKERN